MNSKSCKDAIVSAVAKQATTLSNQFIPSANMHPALKQTNWKRISKCTENGITERVFDCVPYDDQLRAYVYSTDTIISIEIIAE